MSDAMFWLCLLSVVAVGSLWALVWLERSIAREHARQAEHWRQKATRNAEERDAATARALIAEEALKQTGVKWATLALVRAKQSLVERGVISALIGEATHG
jgi:hypothetical protein